MAFNLHTWPLTAVILFGSPVVAEGGDDFTNNLFSDLAPLLTLFGERFALQFLSESFTWLDHIVFAMAPLGVITALVGAIRVGGPIWLRALVGRARENIPTAELELMSSTSRDVCELYNGQSVVRTLGKPEVRQLIYVESLKDGEEQGLFALGNPGEDHEKTHYRLAPQTTQIPFSRHPLAYLTDLAKIVPSPKSYPSPKVLEGGGTSFDVSLAESKYAEDKSLQEAPNISLNLHGGSKNAELALFAIIGTALQLGVLVYAGMVVLYPPLKSKLQGVKPLPGLVLQVGGTIFLIASMGICSYIIEQSTVEQTYILEQSTAEQTWKLIRSSNDRNSQNRNSNGENKDTRGNSSTAEEHPIRILWLQKSLAVGDQNFKSFFLMAENTKNGVLTSRRRPENVDRDLKIATLTTAGIVLGLLGFIAQFEGFRLSNWTCSIAQLGAVGLMTICRAIVRRGMIERPIAEELRTSHEMDWLALEMAANPDFLEPGSNHPAKGRSGSDPEPEQAKRRVKELGARLKIIISDSAESENLALPGTVEQTTITQQELKKCQTAVNIRQRLGQLATWKESMSEEAVALATAIEVVMGHLAEPKLESFTWSLKVAFESGPLERDQQDRISFTVRKEGDHWKADSTKLDALMSLWNYYFSEIDSVSAQKSAAPTSSPSNDWLRPSGSEIRRRCRRVLGRDTDLLHRDLAWWIGDGVANESRDPDGKEQDKGIIRFGFDGIEPEGTVANVNGSGSHSIVAAAGAVGNAENSGNQTAAVVIAPNADSSANQTLSTGTVANVDNSGSQTVLDGTVTNPDKLVVDAPWAGSLSLHIFSAFMWAVSQNVSPGPLGHTSIDPRAFDVDIPGTWNSINLQNDKLLDLARAVQATGLGSLEQVYLSIIPPLSYALVLPDEAVVDLVLQKVSEYESNCHWGKASKVYSELLKISETRMSAQRDGFARRTVATTSECLQDKFVYRSVAAAIELLFQATAKPAVTVSDGTAHFELDALKTKLKVLPLKEIAESFRTAYLDRGQSDQYNSLFGADDTNQENRRKKPLLNTFEYENFKDAHGWMEFQYNAFRAFRESDYVEMNRIDQTEWEKINDTDISGKTMLHYAALSGQEKLGYVLISRGARVDIKGRDGRIPLHCATIAKSRAMVKDLLNQGSPVSAVDNAGRTALHLAMWAGERWIVEVLPVRGSDINAKDNEGWTPLHFAVQREVEDGGGLSPAAFMKREVPIELLIDKYKADVEAKDNRGETPLFHAVRAGNVEVTKLLLTDKCKADVEAKNNSGETPLFCAAGAGNVEITMLLLTDKYKADVEAKNNFGGTPLFYAVQAGNIKVAELLIEKYKAKVEARDDFDETPLFCAVRGGNVEITKLLIDQYKADTEVKNNLGGTVLFYAVQAGRIKVIELLIEKYKADVEAKNNSGETPLFGVLWAGNIEITKLLIDKYKADVEAKNNSGETPLFGAVRAGNVEITKLLIDKYKADVEAKNNSGETPLFGAVRAGSVTMTKLLIDKGADVKANDFRSQTPLSIADTELVQLMKSWTHV